jgi:uncharacterized protein
MTVPQIALNYRIACGEGRRRKLKSKTYGKTYGKHAQERTRAMDEGLRTELEAAAFRRLIEHLQNRSDVQNIELMELAGFCRNCLADWYLEAAANKGLSLSKGQAREIIYGMPYGTWKAKFQKEISDKPHKHVGSSG